MKRDELGGVGEGTARCSWMDGWMETDWEEMALNTGDPEAFSGMEKKKESLIEIGRRIGFRTPAYF